MPDTPSNKPDEVSLRERFVDAILRDKLRSHGHDIMDEWAGANGLIDINSMPGWLRGPAAQMYENAMPLADVLDGIVEQDWRQGLLKDIANGWGQHH